MPKEIKTKSKTRDIKLLNKTANLAAHAKNALLCVKQEDTQETAHGSPSENAMDSASGYVKDISQRTVYRVKDSMSHPFQKVQRNFKQVQNHFQEIKRQLPKERKRLAEQTKTAAGKAKSTAEQLKSKANQAQINVQEAKKTVYEAKQAILKTRQYVQRSNRAANQTIKTGQQTEKGIKQTVKSIKKTGKGTIKAAKNSVKTAQKTAQTAIKSAKQAQKAAKAAEKAARATVEATEKTIKAAIKVIPATIKATIAGVNGLISLIAASGFVAVLIIIIACLVGLLASSAYGIFLTDKDSDNKMTISSVIAEINQEYSNEITKIKSDNPHDEVKMSGSRAAWKEILAVYAIKTSNDSENAQNVVSIDEGKKKILHNIFWDMNVLKHSVKKEDVKEITVTADGKGKLLETEKTVKKTILYIAVSGKIASEMAAQYGFNLKQKALLDELLSEQYDEMWNAVLYGIRSDGTDIVAIAASQIGNVGGQPYWSWYGFENRVEWCACFVSWCADQCGYVEAGIVPKFAACTSQGAPWFKERGLWMEAGNTPKPGDLIFFSWDHDDVVNHVGIVEYVEGDFVHTIEGNSGDAVERQSYGLDSADIKGYGVLCV